MENLRIKKNKKLVLRHCREMKRQATDWEKNIHKIPIS